MKKLTNCNESSHFTKKPAAHCFEHPEEMTEINEMVKIGGQKPIKLKTSSATGKEQQKVGVIKGICISEKRGTAKHEIEEAVFVKDWGIEKDAHAGHWHRQVSLLSYEKQRNLEKKERTLDLELLEKPDRRGL